MDDWEAKLRAAGRQSPPAPAQLAELIGVDTRDGSTSDGHALGALVPGTAVVARGADEHGYVAVELGAGSGDDGQGARSFTGAPSSSSASRVVSAAATATDRVAGVVAPSGAWQEVSSVCTVPGSPSDVIGSPHNGRVTSREVTPRGALEEPVIVEEPGNGEHAHPPAVPESASITQWPNPSSSLKNGRVHRTVYPTREHARRDIARYIEFHHNTKRLHSGLNYRTPREIRNECPNRQEAV